MQIVQSVSYSRFSETNSAKRLDLLTASLSCASFLTAMMVFFWQASVKPAWWQVGWSRLLRPNLVQTWILSSESTYPELASQASLSHCRQEEGGRVAVIIEAHKEHATATVSQWTHRITSTQLASPFFCKPWLSSTSSSPWWKHGHGQDSWPAPRWGSPTTIIISAPSWASVKPVHSFFHSLPLNNTTN